MASFAVWLEIPASPLFFLFPGYSHQAFIK
jgi:hypothetical protein